MHLALIATGGTIAGLGTADRYTAAQLRAEALLDAQPALRQVASWQVEQPFALDSRDMQPAHWLLLAERIHHHLADPAVDGIVIAHGTDTLEETAFALHLLIPSGKPVVLTAAMRPANAPDADGPANLVQAARVAADSAVQGRGVLVVAAGRILAARHVAKQHTQALDAIGSTTGLLGQLSSTQILWRAGARATSPRPLTLPSGASLPRVDIIFAFAGQSPDIIDTLITTGTRGIVVAAAGCGSVTAAQLPGLRRARAAGIAVLRATRIAAGGVPRNHNADDDAEGWLTAAALNPLQARIALMLALAARLSADDTQRLIDTL